MGRLATLFIQRNYRRGWACPPAWWDLECFQGPKNPPCSAGSPLPHPWRSRGSSLCPFQNVTVLGVTQCAASQVGFCHFVTCIEGSPMAWQLIAFWRWVTAHCLHALLAFCWNPTCPELSWVSSSTHSSSTPTRHVCFLFWSLPSESHATSPYRDRYIGPKYVPYMLLHGCIFAKTRIGFFCVCSMYLNDILLSVLFLFLYFSPPLYYEKHSQLSTWAARVGHYPHVAAKRVTCGQGEWRTEFLIEL